MSEISRPLLTDEQISSFLSAIEFRDYFSNSENRKRVFKNDKDLNVITAKSITLIKEANFDLADVAEYNTFDYDKYRSSPYKSDKDRELLRKDIIQQLISQKRPEDDEDVCYGNGGMLPSSGTVDKKRRSIIIIGLPASGKSGIAAKVSDFYNAVLIDSDFAKRAIPEFCKSNGAALVHKESKEIKDEIMGAAIEQGLNFVLPIIGSEYDDVLKIIKNLKIRRYSVNIILVELDRVKATQRAFNRFIQTNRYIPLSKILDEYSNNPSLVFYKLLANKKDLPMALIDTDVTYGEVPKIVLQRNFKQIHNILHRR